MLGQFEVGFAAVPGGGPLTRLPGIVGRGRAFEILLGGEDFDGKLAERYGYVNRAIPDAEFVAFVNAFAERVSRFDLLALADIKRFVNAVSLPADAALTAEADAFGGRRSPDYALHHRAGLPAAQRRRAQPGCLRRHGRPQAGARNSFPSYEIFYLGRRLRR